MNALDLLEDDHKKARQIFEADELEQMGERMKERKETLEAELG